MGRVEGKLLGMGVREAMSVVVMLAGVAGAFSSLQTQVQNCAAQVTVMEQSYVPRSEHAAREAEREKREQEWSARLDRIEVKLDRALERKR